jgi:hypothetical protein
MIEGTKMNIMSIIDNIYGSKNFGNIMGISILVLSAVFLLILFLGLHEKNKRLHPKKKKEVLESDITFDENAKVNDDEVKEEITFEKPVISEKLENFKKNMEVKLENIGDDESLNRVIKISRKSSLMENTRKYKILDIDEIEDTQTLNLLK